MSIRTEKLSLISNEGDLKTRCWNNLVQYYIIFIVIIIIIIIIVIIIIVIIFLLLLLLLLYDAKNKILSFWHNLKISRTGSGQ